MATTQKNNSRLKTSVANAVKKILSLRITGLEMQSESEKKYNFVTEKVQKKVDSLNAQADKNSVRHHRQADRGGIVLRSVRNGIDRKRR